MSKNLFIIVKTSFVLILVVVATGFTLPKVAKADTLTYSGYDTYNNYWTYIYIVNIDKTAYFPGETITTTTRFESLECTNLQGADNNVDVTAEINGVTKVVLFAWEDLRSQYFIGPNTPGDYEALFNSTTNDPSYGLYITENENPDPYGPTTQTVFASGSASIPYTVVGPNLVAGGVTPTTATVNVPFTLFSTITNIGAVDSGGFTDLFLINPTPADFADIQTKLSYNSGGLLTGSSNTAEVTHTFTSTGTWSVLACADKKSSDFTGVITESKENDNCGPWTTITVNPPSPAIDLITGSIQPTSATTSSTAIFRSYISNVGSVNSGSGFTNLFQRANDPEGTIDVQDIGIWERPILQPLFASQRALASFSYNFLPEDAGTTRYMRICADQDSSEDLGTITETNQFGTGETNNCGPWTAIRVNPAAINGACGSAAKNYPYSATGYGSDTQCSSGSPSSPWVFPLPGGSKNWTCSGINYGTPASCTATRDAGTNNASCSNISAPSTITMGESFPASITMHNTGDTRWGSFSYKLSPQDPPYNPIWGTGGISSQIVQPGSDFIVNKTFTAPNTVGTITFAWQMTQGINGWFGEKCLRSITVAPPPPDATISANPTRVPGTLPNNHSNITWSASNVKTSCTISGPGLTTVIIPGPIDAAGQTGGPALASNITAQSTYTIDCDNGAVIKSVIVNILPIFQEF